jgi:hypothetical protein
MMYTKKPLSHTIGLALTLWLLSGCGGAPTEPTTVPTPVSPTPTQVIEIAPVAYDPADVFPFDFDTA